MTDWNPDTYARFTGLRLRPAVDLAAQVPGGLPPGPVVDLGCGNGAVGPLLRARFPGRRLVGLDSSAAMLDVARETGAYDDLALEDITGWRPDGAPSLIFSNAVLQWLDDHDRLIPHLAGLLAPGGVLAVQMPGQEAAPSHAMARDTLRRLFPDRWDDRLGRTRVAPAGDYWRMLSPLGKVTAWETSYVQHVAPAPQGHPVRAFTESTMLRPLMARLDPDQQAAFLAGYDAALDRAYPRLPDGGAVFAFRRVFFVLEV